MKYPGSVFTPAGPVTIAEREQVIIGTGAASLDGEAF
jgi:hypothetical protein